MAGVVLTRNDGWAQITLDRPDKRNALSLAVWRALPGLAAQCGADPAVRLLVLRGVSGVFSGGADLDEFETEYAAAPEAAHAAIREGMEAIAACPKPTLAVIEGFAVGAGLGLAVACDMRLAAHGARFAVPPAKLGLLYSLGDLARLVALIGPARARFLLYTARSVDAATALAWGLIEEAAAPEALEERFARLRTEVLQAAPTTISACKRLFSLISKGQSEETDETRALFADAFRGKAFREGLAAFRQQRPPRFEP